MYKKKMAVLHSGNLRDVSPGGVSEYIVQFIKHSNSEIFHFGTEKKEENIKLWEQYKRTVGSKEYTFIPLNHNARRPLSIYYFISFILFMLTNRRIIKSIDVFYAQRMEYVLPFLILFPKKKVIMAIHGSGRYASLFWGRYIAIIYSLLEYLSIIRANKIVVLNNNKDYGLPYYKSKYSRYSNKFFYAPVPVNFSLFDRKEKSKVRIKNGFKETDKILLFFGRLEHNPKRIYYLPEIFLNIKKTYPECKMLIIGSGNDKDELMNRFEKSGLIHDVYLFNYLRHGEKLVELINCADISIVCSTFEGICMSALESISCGVPVVATNVGDIKEYLVNNVNGYLINESNDEYTINKICQSIKMYFQTPFILDKKSIKNYEAGSVIKYTENLFQIGKDYPNENND